MFHFLDIRQDLFGKELNFHLKIRGNQVFMYPYRKFIVSIFHHQIGVNP